MAYKLEVNHPDFPKDWEFDCDGVIVKNGGSTTLTEQDEGNVFNRSGGRTVKEVFGHKDVPDFIKLTGTKASDIPEGGDT
jgi:hypothetical protein